MKILIPLLLLTLGANANEVVYGSKSGIMLPLFQFMAHSE